ncbi:hypothetical protein SOVF_025550 [Spinacia oleracea]|nr:hypothetical protein SOVF_025550 [Spinacia oleracea]
MRTLLLSISLTITSGQCNWRFYSGSGGRWGVLGWGLEAKEASAKAAASAGSVAGSPTRKETSRESAFSLLLLIISKIDRLLLHQLRFLQFLRLCDFPSFNSSARLRRASLRHCVVEC